MPKNPSPRIPHMDNAEGAAPGRTSPCSHQLACPNLGSALPPLLLRAAQAAAYCGVSEATWWRWDSAGRIPRGRKVSGGVKVWSRPELEEWATLGLPPRAEFDALRAAQRDGRPR
jgi:predicted DNA-binding transcriptional regulator AlpA